MYLWLKLIHIAAVVMFLGNITTGLFWHRHAERTRDPKLLAHTMDGIIRSDRWFTIPGVFAIIIAGVAFMARVAPLQRRMLAHARGTSFDRDTYHRLAKSWEFWAAIALLTPIATLVLMVVKPTF